MTVWTLEVVKGVDVVGRVEEDDGEEEEKEEEKEEVCKEMIAEEVC